MKIKIVLFYVLFVPAVMAEDLSKYKSIGVNCKQYSFFEPEKTPDGLNIVTELRKDDFTFIYNQVTHMHHEVIVKKDNILERVLLFNNPSYRRTRLVDVVYEHNKLELLLSHPQGYYHYLLGKENGNWTTLGVVVIRQREFLVAGHDLDMSITSAKIHEPFVVKIVRGDRVDSYQISYDEKEILREGRAENTAYFK